MNKKIKGMERHIQMLIASRTAMGDTMDQMRAEIDGLLLVNQRMVNTIVQLSVVSRVVWCRCLI